LFLLFEIDVYTTTIGLADRCQFGSVISSGQRKLALSVVRIVQTITSAYGFWICADKRSFFKLLAGWTDQNDVDILLKHVAIGLLSALRIEHRRSPSIVDDLGGGLTNEVPEGHFNRFPSPLTGKVVLQVDVIDLDVVEGTAWESGRLQCCLLQSEIGIEFNVPPVLQFWLIDSILRSQKVVSM